MAEFSPEVMAILGEPVDDAQEASEAPADAPADAVAASPPGAPPEAPKAPQEAARALRQAAQREREFRQAEADIKAQRAELAQHQAEVAEAKELKRLLKEDPMAFLERTGKSFEELGADLSMGKRLTAGDKALEQIAELTAKLAERDARDEARDIEQRFSDVKNQTFEYVKAKPEYAYVNSAGVHEMVMQAAQAHFDETEEIDVDGAAQRVEAYLESLVEKVRNTDKFRSKNPGRATETVPKTLTQRNTSAAPSRTTAAKTDEERFEEAVSLL